MSISSVSDRHGRKLLLAMLLPFIVIVLLWLIEITGLILSFDLSKYGIRPLHAEGLPGVILAPLIHSGFKHLFNNSLPLFFLLTLLFYFYPARAFRIVIYIWLLTGILVWLTGRDSIHIGASGLVYGLATFHFFSGIIRNNLRLTALSLLIVFLYGSMVWGIFPGIYSDVSWESHLSGFVSGILFSLVYRKEGPQHEENWPLEDDEDDKDADVLTNTAGSAPGTELSLENERERSN